MKNSFKTIYTMPLLVAFMFLVVFACEKEEAVLSSSNSAGLRSERASGCAVCTTSCETVPDSVVFTSDTVIWVAGSGEPGPFETRYFDFSSATKSTTSGQLIMTGSFNSFFKADTANCWKVGYLPTTYSCEDLESLSCTDAKTYTSTDDICSDGLGFEDGGCKGWYSYTTPPPYPPVATPIRLVSVFCDSDNDGDWDANEKGYVVCVDIQSQQQLISSPPPTYNVWAKYTFKYKCCPAT